MKIWIFNIFCILLVSLGVLIVILFNSNPTSGGAIAISAFIFFLFLFLSSLFTLVMILPKRIYSLFDNDLKVVMRRAILLSILIVGALALNALHVFNAISAISYVFAVVLIEIFFSVRKKKI